MLRPRIIPCLLVSNKGLVKTVKFDSPKYVGDPLNAVRIFNEKEVDELLIFDIDASRKGTEPDYEMIRAVAAECRMPLCYGGGVKTLEQAVRIIKSGVEKVAVSSLALESPAVVAEIARFTGSQSVVAVIDVKQDFRSGKYEIWSHNATRNTRRNPVEFAKEVEGCGVGEIAVNAIDQDGVMKGYDLKLVRRIRDVVSVPMTVLGGAGNLQHIETLLNECGVVGAAAGSLFVFKGVYRAVLINYPSPAEKAQLCASAMAY